MENVLLGVSGSVAAYKAAELVRLLRGRNVAVRVALTPAGGEFVGAATFRALSGQPVLTDEFRAPQAADGMDHIAAARAADALLVAPASADFLAKAAAGFADNVLLAAFLAADCRRVVAPAMNRQMWAAAATRRNIAQLAADGVEVFPPADGEQACGEVGAGRMMEPADIVARLLDAPPSAWAGRRVVVNTGATAEAIDAMRIVSNRSSGKMGFCLAAAAAGLGAETQLIAGRVSAAPPPGVALRRAEEGEAMRAAVLEETARADWFFAAAAVADFRPAAPARGKPPRKNGGITLSLKPTEDILAAAQAARPDLRCVGFAAQSGAAAAQKKQGREKMRRKKIPYLVVNDAADAGRDDCQLTLLFGDGGEEVFPRQDKAAAARQLLDFLVSYETS